LELTASLDCFALLAIKAFLYAFLITYYPPKEQSPLKLPSLAFAKNVDENLLKNLI
jgi:hypothetical protein